MEVSSQLHAPATLTPEKQPLYRILDGPQSWSGCYGEDKYLTLNRELNRLFGHPAHSLVQYWLHYPGSYNDDVMMMIGGNYYNLITVKLLKVSGTLCSPNKISLKLLQSLYHRELLSLWCLRLGPCYLCFKDYKCIHIYIKLCVHL
jgi:hypothetical protein